MYLLLLFSVKSLNLWSIQIQKISKLKRCQCITKKEQRTTLKRIFMHFVASSLSKNTISSPFLLPKSEYKIYFNILYIRKLLAKLDTANNNLNNYASNRFCVKSSLHFLILKYTPVFNYGRKCLRPYNGN